MLLLSLLSYLAQDKVFAKCILAIFSHAEICSVNLLPYLNIGLARMGQIKLMYAERHL